MKIKLNFNMKRIPFKILLILSIFAFFEPLMIDRMAGVGYSNMIKLHRIFSILKYLIFIIVTIYYLTYFKFKIKKVLFLFLIYSFFLFISTIINEGDIRTLIAISYPSITFIMISELIIFKDEFYFYNKVMFRWLSILILFNLYLMFKFPYGMYVDYRNWKLNWLFGNYQQNMLIFIPAIISGLICLSHDSNKIQKNYVAFIFCVIVYTTYLTESKTTIVMIFVGFILYLLKNIKMFNRILSSKYIFISCIIFSVMIIIFKLQYLFSFIIEDILKKSLSFSGREIIWDVTLKHIMNRPFMGIGAQKSEYIARFLTVTSRSNHSTHNQYLSIIFTGGLVSFFIFYIITIKSLKILKRQSKNKLANIIAIGLISYFVIFISEAWRDLMYYFMLICYAYYIDEIKSDNN